MYAINKQTRRRIAYREVHGSWYGTCPVHVKVRTDGTAELQTDTDDYQVLKEDIDLDCAYCDDEDNRCSFEDIVFVEALSLAMQECPTIGDPSLFGPLTSEDIQHIRACRRAKEE